MNQLKHAYAQGEKQAADKFAVNIQSLRPATPGVSAFPRAPMPYQPPPVSLGQRASGLMQRGKNFLASDLGSGLAVAGLGMYVLPKIFGSGNDQQNQ